MNELKGQGDGFRRADPTFFEQLARAVEAKPSQPPIKRRLLPRWVGAAAAAVLLLVLARYAINAGSVEETYTADADELIEALTDEEIFAYIEENVADFELELLTEELELESFTE
ncbi:MAG: hypothetical protein AAGF87_03920 [Bacteroidota bacterium]